MVDYKNSLNLPETAFPMKANLAKREPECLKIWEETKLYNKIRDLRAGASRFVLHDGPPYANGHLHSGHALNKILKDIIVKSKTLAGFDSPFIPGWDCHGLPIELNVEKKVGKAGLKISPQEFRAKCRDYALSQIDIQRQEFKRLGVFGDWEAPYITSSFAYEAQVIRALAKIIANGHLEQGFMPVYWCFDCGSALAEAEIEYEDKESASIDVAFYAEKPQDFLALIDQDLPVKPLILPIWTTTPWSLPANEAVCLHPEAEYELVDLGDRYLLVAQALIEPLMQRYQISSYSCKGSRPGKLFAHLEVKHPLEERLVPVIFAEHVTMDSGTGCVHTAPAHGREDYLAGKAFNLPLINPVSNQGLYAEGVPHVGKTFVLKANEPLIALLKERGLLLYQEKIQHSYPHCWRHKSPTIFLATAQWFISMDKKGLRSAMLKEIDKVNWLPDWGKARITQMIEGKPDWCISRQRHWGTPLPLFVHKETKALHPESLNILEEVARRVEKEGIDAWFELKPETLLGQDAKNYLKINDCLDVWFDSGVSHYAVLKDGLGLPADVYLEGSDQHRGWFNSSLTTAVAIYGQAPYKMVLTHGYTVDAEGRKLSKSAGNYIGLDKLIEEYGADVLRLWVASMDYRHEVSLSAEILKRRAEAYRRIRNTARFLLANLADFKPNKDLLSAKQLLELDAFALKMTQDLQEEILHAYETYQFHLIYQKIHNFCAMDLGSFYLDVIKDRLYTTGENSLPRRSCQTVMYHIVQALTLWLAPILSFTAEEIWGFIPRDGEKTSVFCQTWYDSWPLITQIDGDFWQKIRLLRDEVNKALERSRKEGKIGSALEAELTLYLNPEWLSLLKRIAGELRFIFISSMVDLKPMGDLKLLDELELANAYQCAELELAIEVRPSTYEKCARCWHRVPDIGSDTQNPDLCPRCSGNLGQNPEQRFFA